MSKITQELLDEITAKKEKLMDVLIEIEGLLHDTGDYMAQERFRQYVKGNVEQACNSVGFHNTCIESIVNDLAEELEPEEECGECNLPHSECEC